jgi:hypothetical protein
MSRFALIVLTLPACSMLFVPAVEPKRPLDCNTSRAAPVGDIALGLVHVVASALAFSFVADGTSCFDNICQPTKGNSDAIYPALVFGGFALGHFVSASVGYGRAGECREARAQVLQPSPSAPADPAPGPSQVPPPAPFPVPAE